jgi:hypothetical protein
LFIIVALIFSDRIGQQKKQSEPEQFLYFGFDTDVFNKSSKLIGS